jgi:diadenosine tetraphosphate (Ap4A) HIT family hydrolase/ribosome-associated translation inhibitor RaiA
MVTRIQSVHFDASQQLVEFVEKKVAKLEKLCEGATSLEVAMKLIKPETSNNKEVALRLSTGNGELFASKTSDTFDTVKEATEKIAKLKPSFMSVTYGAGGGTSEYTVSVAKNIKDNCGVDTIAHLTCINSNKDDIQHRLEALKNAGIENILALRGDITPENKDKINFDYRYASELVEDIKKYGAVGIEICLLDRLTPALLVDRGICPTCFDKENGGVLYGDGEDKLIYKDDRVECFLAGNPRAEGHAIISSVKHYKDMSELPAELCAYVFCLAQRLMRGIKETYGCESVYLCTMCDGPMNHFHLQLIPRYSFEKRGSTNFVKPRSEYLCNSQKLEKLRKILNFV